MEAAMKDDGTAKAVIDAANFRTVCVSKAFEKMYGLPAGRGVPRGLVSSIEV
jgi:hypothetical protein